MIKIKSIKTQAFVCLAILAWLVSPVSLAQSCNLETTPNAPDHRYQDNADSTVTDLTTNLMWRQCAVGLSGADCLSGSVEAFTWQGALDAVAASNLAAGFAGYNDWRLPNIKELRSLISLRCIDPAINVNLFPNTPQGWYWSSSPTAYDSTYSWYVNFGSGFSHGYERSFQHSPIRLVRTLP